MAALRGLAGADPVAGENQPAGKWLTPTPPTGITGRGVNLLGRQRGVFPDHPIKVPDSTDEIFQVLYELAV
jgi:hypothetical protein